MNNPTPTAAKPAASLSILIPTYNRPVDLVRTLHALIPQCMSSGCRIHIIDNASPIPVEEIVNANFGDHLEMIAIVRNAVNIGGNANICRCFEFCDTEWMWLLGDDDLPEGNALEIIRNAISAAPASCCMLNFASNISEEQSTDSINNFEELSGNIRQGFYFRNLLFISTSVYRMEPLRGHIAHAYHFAYSCAPQLILPFLALCKGFSIHNRRDHVVKWKDPAAEEAWNPRYLVLGLITISDHPDLRPMTMNVTRPIMKSMIGSIYPYVKFSIKNLITCPENELQFWSSAYLRIASNLSIMDKAGLLFLSQMACVFRLMKPCRNLMKKALKLNSTIDNLART